MKVFNINKNVLYLLGIVVILSLSCNKEIYDEEIKSTNIPYNIKEKVDQFLLKNQHLFPNKIIPTILWNNATTNDSYLDVEVKFTKEKSIFLPIGAVGDGNIKIGKTFYKINMEDISNIYVYNIIPENYKIFANENFTIQNIKNADFYGYVTISNIFKNPFVVMQYEKGKLLQYSKEISLEKIGRDTKKIKERYWKCWWWNSYSETQINDGEPDISIASNSNGFFVTSNSSTGQVEYEYTLGFTCVWIPYDDGFGDGDFYGDYPWLADDGGEGGGGGFPPDHEYEKCKCTSSTFTSIAGQWQNIFYGKVDFDYIASNLDCNNGSYNSEIVPHVSSTNLCVNIKEEHIIELYKEDVYPGCKWLVDVFTSIWANISICMMGEDYSGIFPVNETFQNIHYFTIQ